MESREGKYLCIYFMRIQDSGKENKVEGIEQKSVGGTDHALVQPGGSSHCPRSSQWVIYVVRCYQQIAHQTLMFRDLNSCVL